MNAYIDAYYAGTLPDLNIPNVFSITQTAIPLNTVRVYDPDWENWNAKRFKFWKIITIVFFGI